MKTVDVLNRIRNRVARRWNQGNFLEARSGSVCLIGAVNVVTVPDASRGRFEQHGVENDASEGFVGNHHPGYMSPSRVRALSYLLAAVTQETFGRSSEAASSQNSTTDDVARMVSLLIEFNDGERRSKKEVLRVIDRAVRNAKRRHING